MSDQSENGLTDAGISKNPAVRLSADLAADSSAKVQEGFSVPTTRVTEIPSFHQAEKEPNGVQISKNPAVRTSADFAAEASAKAQEGISVPTTAFAH